eukprot:7481749-Ditylum_brightwellii.AAC.2
MDTFFAAKKVGKSSRGNTCCQLFATNKGFLYTVPMERRREVLQAVKKFVKEIGIWNAIIADAAKEQMSLDLRQFCEGIGSTPILLEEGTPWANRTKLYIGLIKEAVRKDKKDSDCPLPFWNYCVERRVRINNLIAKNLLQLHDLNPHMQLTGEEADISNLCQFK